MGRRPRDDASTPRQQRERESHGRPEAQTRSARARRPPVARSRSLVEPERPGVDRVTHPPCQRHIAASLPIHIEPPPVTGRASAA
jgi:hypothetical protein